MGTIYNDKYSSINQCSPTTPNIDVINNFEIFHAATISTTSSTTSLPSHSLSPNTLNPSLSFGKLDTFSHSETYQSNDYSLNSINNESISKHKLSTTVSCIKCDQIESNKNNTNRWFNFLNQNRKKSQSQRRSTFSALFNS